MAKKVKIRWLALLAAASGANGQHAADNPIVSADDAFGLTIGTESVGIYNPGGVRGFNPQIAGNVRIDGLYFDQQGALSNRVIEGSAIRVGITEIGYAFPAPTGIVDYELRHATNGEPTGTVIAQAGPYQSRSISLDGSLPLSSTVLQLPIGASFQTGGPILTGANRGYTATTTNVGAAPQWKPNDRLTIRAFADWQDVGHAQTLPTVFTGGDFLPPHIATGYLGQNWAQNRLITQNFGATIDAKLSSKWSLAAGVFNSVSDAPQSYADLYVDTQPDGLADHMLVGSPEQRVDSTSGEVRLRGQFTPGSWAHNVIFLIRGRDTVAQYGGSDVIDAGPAHIDQDTQLPPPDFVYSARTDDRTRLWSMGTAYQGRWPGFGEFDFGVQNEHYDKMVAAPGVSPAQLSADPWRLYATAAAPVTGQIAAYAGYTQGFEDSGAAPSSAANRGAILPTTRTWQIDSGLRYRLTSDLNLIAGVFELNRPYFNFDASNVDRPLGVQRASGIEFSIAGQLSKGLNINAGALLGEVLVKGPDLAAQGIGSTAVGQPHNQIQFNLDYDLPVLSALSVDVGMFHFGSVPAIVSNGVYVPAVTVVNIGDRYRFKLLGAPATLRLQLQNLTNAYIWNIGYSPGLFQFPPRTFLAYLTVDV